MLHLFAQRKLASWIRALGVVLQAINLVAFSRRLSSTASCQTLDCAMDSGLSGLSVRRDLGREIPHSLGPG
jgi:hypothetical protein